MNIELFIAKKISTRSNRTFSRLIVYVAMGGIALGLTVMILALTVIRGFKTEIREKARNFSGDIQVVKYALSPAYEQNKFVYDDDLRRQINLVSSHLSISAYAAKAGLIKTRNEVEGVVFKGYDVHAHWARFSKLLIQGCLPKVTEPNEVMISKKIADVLHLHVGDSFLMYFIQNPPKKRKLKIAGIFELGFEVANTGTVIGNLSQISHLEHTSSQEVGGLEIGIEDFEQLDKLTLQLHQCLPKELRAYSVKEWYPDVFEWLNLLDVNTEIILVLMLIVAVINMISALLILILERTHLIGLLKAFGANNWMIQKIFLYNAAQIIGIGMLLGNMVGGALSLLQYWTHFVGLDTDSYYVAFVPIAFHWADLLILNVVTFVVCLLVMLLPSVLISRISPIKAIVFQ